MFAAFNLYSMQDDDRNPPTISRSGQPINYAVSADKPNIDQSSAATTLQTYVPVNLPSSSEGKKT